MSTNVYRDQDADLTQRGLRWCSKHNRWETRRTISEADAQLLAQELQCGVELRSTCYPNGLKLILPESVPFKLEED